LLGWIRATVRSKVAALHQKRQDICFLELPSFSYGLLQSGQWQLGNEQVELMRGNNEKPECVEARQLTQ
jgi:hypothetical protein